MKIEVKYFEDIATEIKRLDEVMVKISNSGLTNKAIVLLVARLSGESQTTVNNVIYGLENLKSFLKK